jgi:hypothetical protein
MADRQVNSYVDFKYLRNNKPHKKIYMDVAGTCKCEKHDHISHTHVSILYLIANNKIF